MFTIKTGRVKGNKPTSTFGKKPFKGSNKNRKGRKKESVLGVKIMDKRITPKQESEPEYIKWFHENHQPPCFVCGTYLGIEFHHIKEHSVDKRIDSVGMPLCWEHHHGTVLSPHGAAVKFKEVYPMEVQLKYAKNMYELYSSQKM